MKMIKLILKEKFELSDGVTVLACEGDTADLEVIGRQFHLVSGDKVKQTLNITGERNMLNKNTSGDQRAFETSDIVLLSSEEIRNGNWTLVVK